MSKGEGNLIDDENKDCNDANNKKTDEM